MSSEEPWLVMKEVYRDVTLLVEGSRLSYHKAVLSQHSRLVRSLLQDQAWCQCYDVVISLDGVSLRDVQFVMELIYSGAGGISSQSHGDIRPVLSMLEIDTILVDDLVVEDGLVLETSNPVDYGAVEAEDVLVTKALTTSGARPSAEVKTTERRAEEDGQAGTGLKKTAEVGTTVVRRRGRGRKRKQEDVVTKPKLESREESASTGLNKPATVQAAVVTGKEAAEELSTASNKKSKAVSVEVCEITIEDDDKSSQEQPQPEKYLCPYRECQSESKNAQSIKVHLALVHYKKTIQAEFPNWAKQKCEMCDKIFGQMTAYYLHMANHRKYKYMDLSPDQFRASNRDNIPQSPRAAVLPASKVEKAKILRPETVKPDPGPSQSPGSASVILTPVRQGLKTVYSAGKLGGIHVRQRSNSFVQSGTKLQQVKTPIMKIEPKIGSKNSVTPVLMRGKVPPGPSPASPGPPSFTFVDTRVGETQPTAAVTRRPVTWSGVKQYGQSKVNKQRGS